MLIVSKRRGMGEMGNVPFLIPYIYLLNKTHTNSDNGVINYRVRRLKLQNFFWQ